MLFGGIMFWRRMEQGRWYCSWVGGKCEGQDVEDLLFNRIVRESFMGKGIFVQKFVEDEGINLCIFRMRVRQVNRIVEVKVLRQEFVGCIYDLCIFINIFNNFIMFKFVFGVNILMVCIFKLFFITIINIFKIIKI